MLRPRFPARIAKVQFALRLSSLLVVVGVLISWIVFTASKGTLDLHAWVALVIAIGIDSSECITLCNISRTRRRMPNIAILAGDLIVMIVLAWGAEVSTLARYEPLRMRDSGVAGFVEIMEEFALIFLRAVLFLTYSVIAYRQSKRRSSVKEVQEDGLPLVELRATEPNFAMGPDSDTSRPSTRVMANELPRLETRTLELS